MNEELLYWTSQVNIISDKQIDYEFSGDSGDLMKIRGFATHEGVNANGTRFRREILQKTYNSLLNKPLRILTDFFNMPTGHGFDRKTKKFSKNIINIGHIINVKPVIVGDDEQILAEVKDLNSSDLPEGNYRILFDAVIYKQYYDDIAEVLTNLHNNNDLKFSIEANMNYELSESGVKDATDLKFIGLSIVRSPAFEKAFSILVAEEEDKRKELDNLEFEQMYNELKEQHDVIVAEKATLEADKVAIEATLAEKITEIAELSEKITGLENDLISKNTEIVTMSEEVSNLQEYKEKFEQSEKEQVGKDRLAKLTELGEVELTVAELAVMSELDYSNAQVEMARALIEKTKTLGSAMFDTNMKNNNAGKLLRKALFGE